MINRAHQIALLATATFITALIILLCVIHMSWPADKKWPPEPEPYIEMAVLDEFVIPEEIPLPPRQIGDQSAPAQTETDLDNPAETAPETGHNINNGPVEGKPAQPVTTSRPAPVKTPAKPQPSKTGSPAPDPNAAHNQAVSRQTNNQTANAFAQSTSKNNANNAKADKGRAGRTNGSADSNGPADSKSTTPGIKHGRLGGGFAWPALPKNIATDKTGTVIIEFTINPDGSVVHSSVKPIGGKIPASTDGALKTKCIKYVQALKFPFKGNKRPDAPIDGNTLTFTFGTFSN